jgi:hypothetical protein
LVALPEFSQISPICPSKQEIAFRISSRHSGNELDDIWVMAPAGVDVSLDLSFPLGFELSQFCFIISMDLLDLFDSNIGSFAVELIKI